MSPRPTPDPVLFGPILSGGGTLERIAGWLMDQARELDLEAAAHASHPAAWAAIAGAANGLRRAVVTVSEGTAWPLEGHQVDALYAQRYGELVRDAQGRPAGNAAGDPTPDRAWDDVPLPLEDC